MKRQQDIENPELSYVHYVRYRLLKPLANKATEKQYSIAILGTHKMENVCQMLTTKYFV